MRAKNLATLLVVISSFSCSSVSLRPRLPVCLTDPANNALHCDGVTIPWAAGAGYVCHKLEDHEEYMRGCR